MRREEMSIRKVDTEGVTLQPETYKRYNLEVLTGTINYNVADPYTVSLGTARAGSQILAVMVDIETAFNAATTNVLVVGTSADDDCFVAADDVDESSETVQFVGQDGSTLSSDTEIFAKYTQTGTAATAGKAHVSVILAQVE